MSYKTQGAPNLRPRVLLGVSDCLASVDFIKLALEIFKSYDLAIVLNKRAKYYYRIANEYDRESWLEFQQLIIDNKVRIFTDDHNEIILPNILKKYTLSNDLVNWANILIIAPLSTNCLAKITNGINDNLLTSIVRSWGSSKLLILVPSMNRNMFNNSLTQKHLCEIANIFKNTKTIINIGTYKLPITKIIEEMNYCCTKTKIKPIKTYTGIMLGVAGIGAAAAYFGLSSKSNTGRA